MTPERIDQPTSHRPDLRGAACVLGAATLWGTTGTVSKLIYGAGPDPFVLAAARTSLAAMILGAALAVSNRRLLAVPRSELPGLALFSLAGLGLCQFSYLMTLSLTSVGIAVLLQATAPFFTLGHALVRGQERPNPAKALVMAAALAGGALVVMGGGGWGVSISGLGLASGLTSAVCLSYYSLRAKDLLQKYSPWTLLFWGSAFSALAWWAVLPPGRLLAAFSGDPALAAGVLYISVFSTIIPFGLYLKGVARLVPSTAGVFNTFEPVAAAGIAYLVLGERLAAAQLTGGLVLLMSLALLQGVVRERPASG